MEAPGRIWFGYIAAVGIAVIGLITLDPLAFGLAVAVLVATVLGEWYRGRQIALAAAAQDADLPELVSRWARGWAYARGFPRPATLPGGVRVEVGQPGRQVEWVATDDADTLAGLVDTARATPEAWLSVVAESPEGVRPWFVEAGLVTDDGEEALMSIDLADQASRELPEGYRAEVERDGGVITVTVRSGEAAAADGTIAVIGTDAVADRIRTDPDHRRRGLGGAVMTLLVAAAREAGAGHGLLVASAMGEPLYADLGWRAEARLVTARSPAPHTSVESQHG
ncbi:Acetyltransferase (GNAT) domain-containing protein [Nocardioides sp. YR527]|uniref:GNAT family N-acetyltransferase n=1 Tax=Nocardioides sp. YR527 TaxID=1881028 RepID=UPI0008807A2E|nr:GNAT family N-acetyltransferase [Nocardioides sp. YR527]SDJ73663.1 Acetyltransferase (GNAT) domain-containing protein [Nocardioides sp. YR527]